MEAAKIGPDLRLPIINPFCSLKFRITFLKFSWLEIEDSAYSKFWEQTRCIVEDVQMAKNNFLWNMAFLMGNRFENNKQIIVVLSLLINSQKQENRPQY